MVLSDVTATENEAGQGGGISTTAIEPDNSFTATDLTLTFNTSTGHGGGIYAGGTAHLTGVVISDNHSNQAGGGFWGAATITNFTVTGNTASWYGGGLNLTGNGVLTATNGLIEDNDGTDQGGGISSQQWGTVVLTDVTVRNNVAAHGAGIHNGYGSSIDLVPRTHFHTCCWGATYTLPHLLIVRSDRQASPQVWKCGRGTQTWHPVEIGANNTGRCS